jgi:hypothetical protein
MISEIQFSSSKFFLKTFAYFLFFTIILLTSCKDSNEYRVDSAFTDYLQRFETEAALHNRTFDLQNTGLIIEFANLKNNVAGLTHYEDPIRIEIDRTYWKAIANSAGADEMREDLIFHELGHGLLGRKHLNSTLKNGDWKSIMCGGDKVNDRPWNINYKGIRRTYYINELFDESTLVPDFSRTDLPADTSGYVSKLKLSFDNLSNAGWPMVDDTQHKIILENGRLRFESKVSDVYLVVLNTKTLDIQADFSYELNLEYSSTTDLTGQYGILFGLSTTISHDSLEYFTINRNQKMQMGNRTWYSFFTELTENQILQNGKNKLKVFKIGNMIYYFINNVYSYCSEIEMNKSAYQYGFIVPANGVVLVDNLAIAQRTGVGVPAKLRQLQQNDFECIKIKSLNQNKIHN